MASLAVVEKALEPLHVDPSFQVLLHQKITNSFLVTRVLLLITIILFIGFLGFTCRSLGSVREQLESISAERRDLDHHIEVLCSTDYKTRHWELFVLLSIEMACCFVTMVYLKFWLDKLAYYCCRNLKLPLSKFHERLIVFKLASGDNDAYSYKKLRNWVIYGSIGYVVIVFINVAIPITSLILRYSIPFFRDFYIPHSKDCGPDLFWVDDEDFEAEFKCHFEHEWELFYLFVSTDIVLLVFSLWLPCTLFFLYHAFVSKYFLSKDDEEYELDIEIME